MKKIILSVAVLIASTIKTKSAPTAKWPKGLRIFWVRVGNWWEANKPKAMGIAKSISKLHQIDEGSIAKVFSHADVSGLVATIQLKLKGVATKAITLATAETLTDKAVLPLPMCVTTLLKLPPGQAATKIMAVSMFEGRSKTSVANHVPTGSKINCGIKPQITALGVCATRLKSSRRNSKATEKTMVAKTKPKTHCCEPMSVSFAKSIAYAMPRKIKG